MEFVPVTIQLEQQRWLLVGTGVKAMRYRQMLRAVGTEVLVIGSEDITSTIGDQQVAADTDSAIKVSELAELLTNGDIDGIACFSKHLLSPIQRQKIEDSSIPFWLHGEMMCSDIILPDSISSAEVQVLLRVDSKKYGFRQSIQKWRDRLALRLWSKVEADTR